MPSFITLIIILVLLFSHVNMAITLYILKDLIKMNGIDLFLFLLLLGVVIFVIWAVKARAKNKKAESLIKDKLEELKSSGFNIDYILDEGYPNVVFDDTEKKVVFLNACDMVSYNYSDIKGWSHHWVDKDAKKTYNRLVFKLQDKETPMITVQGLSAGLSEHWMAKLDAILNE